MWPWEHLAVGYLLYSLGSRAVRGERPSETGTLVLLFGTQLPDLVDKPLSWGLGLFPSGFAIAHSVFVAVPVGVVAVVVADRLDHRQLGVALAVGYWSHLLADVVNTLRFGQDLGVERVLWPLVTHDPYATDYGLARGWVYLTEFVRELATMEVTAVLVLYVLVPLPGLLLWVADGSPGPRGLYRFAVTASR